MAKIVTKQKEKATENFKRGRLYVRGTHTYIAVASFADGGTSLVNVTNGLLYTHRNLDGEKEDWDGFSRMQGTITLEND